MREAAQMFVLDFFALEVSVQKLKNGSKFPSRSSWGKSGVLELRIRWYFLNLLTSLIFVNLTNSLASAATLTYTDGVCEYRVAYDSKRIDGGQLKASFDYLAGSKNAIELPPTFTTSEDIATIDIPAYHRHCAASHRLLAESVFVALDGLDELRRRELEELDATCARSEALLAAAKGDIAPARAYAAACTRYMDLLALPAPRLRAQWNDLVMDLCHASTDRNICAGSYNGEERVKAPKRAGA